MNKKTYQCKYCDKQYTRKSSINRHVTSTHERVKFKCDICQKLFTDKHKLKQHIKSVHFWQRFPCDLCDYKATEHIIQSYQKGP